MSICFICLTSFSSVFHHKLQRNIKGYRDSVDIEGSWNAARVKGVFHFTCHVNMIIIRVRVLHSSPYQKLNQQILECETRWSETVLSVFVSCIWRITNLLFCVMVIHGILLTVQQVNWKFNFQYANLCMYGPSHTASIRPYGDRLGEAYNRVRLLMTERESKVKLILPRGHSF